MALRLKLKTPLFPPPLNLKSKPQAPLTLTPIPRSGEASSLQQEYDAILKRVVGESPSSSSFPSSSSSPSPSSPCLFPSCSSPASTPPAEDDMHSNYDEAEAEVEAEGKEAATPQDPNTTSLPISSPSSYAGLASLNPYHLDAEDLSRRLSLIPTEPPASAHEDRRIHSEDSARLARELDRAYAAVQAEEAAAMRALQLQTRLE
ncbi:hypothetical protein F4859DRAFT_525794 [Xylaria cf. heliscus]|nr:hypothetical protein F4859DRAFT_525794 [Xylaria cf. heliscus]